MKPRFRLLPVVIFCAALTVTLKLGNLWHGIGGFVSPSLAQETRKPATAEAKKSKKLAAAKSDEKHEKAGQNSTENTKEKKPPEQPSKSWFDPAMITDAELQVLQNLSERRRQIEQRESDLDMRAGLLQATEQRIVSKIAELKVIQTTIEGLLKRHDKQRDKQMQSVVKIYEKMKPKDAARIFEQLDMAILLDVVERMREAKTAPIMANMSPVKAKAVTAAMARRRALPKPESPDLR